MSFIQNPRLRTSWVSLSIFLLLSACSSSSKRPGTSVSDPAAPAPAPPPSQQEPSEKLSPAEKAAYQSLQKSFNAHSFDQVIQNAGEFEKKFPKSGQLAHVKNLKGLAYLFVKKPLQAIHQFRKSAELSPNPGFRQYILFNLAAAQTDADHLDEAEGTLTEIDPGALDQGTQVKYYSLQGKLAQKRGDHFHAAQDFLSVSRLLDERQLKGSITHQLSDSLKQITNLGELEKLYKDYEDAPLIDLVLFRMGAQALAEGKPSAGEEYLKKLTSNFPQSVHLADAGDLLKSLESRAVVDSKAIGVLLPMNGKFSRFGKRSLQAIQMAFRIFNAKQPQSQYTLVIEDAGEDPAQALKALNRLYFKHHVIGVIGPLLSKGVDQITQRAQELGLPMVTLSQQQGVDGNYIFESGLTPQLQAEEIARYAIENLKLKRFAVVHPQDRFGEQYSESFWNAVEAMGGEVVGIESYPAGNTDFRNSIDKLSGLHFTEARQREIAELEKLRTQDKITKRTRKTEHYYALKPIVDYDAVFIPDEPKVVGQILPTFAYRDVDKMRFLGISTWHSPELISRAQQHAEGAVFVDAFDPKSQSKAVREFVELYVATFNENPGQIEALAFDAARIMEEAAQDSNGKRESLRDQLAGIRGFSGVTGKVSYRDGQFLRDLHVLGIQKGSFVNLREEQKQAMNP